MKKQLTNTLIIASITIVLVLSILFFVPSNGSHWIVLNNERNDDYYLGSVFLHFDGEGSRYVPFFRNGNNLLFYDGMEKKHIIQTIPLPGELIDYEFDVSGPILFTVKDENKTKLLYYRTFDDMEFVSSSYTDCTHFVNGFYKRGSNDFLAFAMQSDDKRKIETINYENSERYNFTNKKPFVKIYDSNLKNLVFDGDRAFDVYNPTVDIYKFDYTGFEQEHVMLDFSKDVITQDNWFYNNNILFKFDQKFTK